MNKEVKFRYKIGDRLVDKGIDLTIIDRKIIKDERVDKLGRKSIANLKYYKYYCNICNFNCDKHYNAKLKEYKEELWVEENNLKRGQKCSCCSISSHIIVENVNSIYYTDPWMIPYVGEEVAKTHTHGSGDKVEATCPDCGRVKDKKITIRDIYRSHSINCDCSDEISYPNKFAYELLDQLNSIYKFDYVEHEYSPNWIGNKRYDNYFVYNGKEYIIEMDGKLGHGKTSFDASSKIIEESKIIDDYKDEQARLHGIEIIRINCDKSDLEFIKQNISNSGLNEIFDLTYIDWKKCDEFALSNLIKRVCLYKKNNSNLTSTQIALIFKIHRTTVVRYLKKGNKHGWCNYNPISETTKKVEIFKDKISLGIYKSASELERLSEELFGIKLNSKNISQVCNNNRKTYKGYTFNFV